MLDKESADDLLRATVYDTEDNKIGRVGRVYLDDRSGQPEWVTVQSGLFGTKETFLPLGQAQLDGDRLVVPIAKDAVKTAPHIDPDSGHLSLEEEQALYQHYGLSHDGGNADDDMSALPATPLASPFETDTPTRETSGPGSTSDSAPFTAPDPTPESAPYSAADQRDSSSTTDRSSTTDTAAGSDPPAGLPPSGLRLRRHLVTEDQQITVPVVREEYILEPDPDADPNRVEESSAEPGNEEQYGSGR